MRKKLLSKVMLLLALLLVGAGNVWANSYKLVKAASELSEGDVILITSATSGSAKALGAQSGNNCPAKDVTISDETITTLGEAQEITLSAKNSYGRYTLCVGTNTYLYAANSSSGKNNYLKTKSSTVYWSIAINETSYVATIKDEDSDCNSRNWLRYNSNNTIFSCYGSGQNDVYVFKKVSVPAAPTFNVAAGNFNAAFDLTITGEAGTTLKYTTDGSDPANATETASNTATVSIPAATTTVRAIAIKDGVSSEEATATYTYVDASKEAPTFSLSDTELNLKVNGEGYIELTTNSDGNITFSCADNHVTIEAVDELATVSASAAGIYTINVSVAETETYQSASGTVTLNVTKKATTVTIDASAIGNTDIYTNNDDNLLGASVTYNNAAVAGATVTWTSSNTSVATIDEDGVITLVAAGSTTITATYAGNDEYEGASATYNLTVTNSEPYVQPTEFDISLNDSFFGTNYGGTASGITDEAPVSATQDNVTVTYAGSGNHYINTSQIRFYPNNKLTFDAPTGYNITKIVFTSGGTWAATISANSGTYTSNTKTWEGEATSVLFTGSGSSRCDMSKATITLALPSSVATPVITLAAGTYEEVQTTTITCETEGATIYYTLDGSTPSASSTAYTAGANININESCTLKAIAIKNNESSAVASATYTINLPLTTIAAVKALSSGDTFKLNLTGAQVVYIDNAKKNIYVRDASGAIDLFNSSGFSTSLATGDILSGIIEGTYSPYKNLPEIKDIDISVLTRTRNEVVVAKTIDGTTSAIAANLCDLVKIENTEITESSSKYYVGDNSDIQLYDNFSVGYTVTTGKSVDVSGIATVYNSTYEIFPRYESDIVYLESSEAVGITSTTGYATFCSTKALDFTAVDAIYAYIATADGTTGVNFTRITKIPANIGVLLYSTEGGAVDAINVPVLDSDADATTGNVFVAATTEIAELASTDGTKSNYILNNGGSGIGFYPANGQKVAAGKAYIQISENLVKGFIGLPDGMETAIQGIETSKQNDAIYNLSGQRVQKPVRGLYIVNGKKVLVK